VTAAVEPTRPIDLLGEVVARLDQTPDPRVLEVMTALVTHLHEFAAEVRLTEAEWAAGIAFLTATGQKCDDKRQEFIMLSDTLGLSTLVDLLAHDGSSGATESTVLGPFYVPGSPERANGDSTAERPSGVPAFVSGRVLDSGGQPLAGARVDVWQNGADSLYAVQDPDAPVNNLRGVFTTDADGAYSFLCVRPVDYSLPPDGPVGDMLALTGRHTFRAAHLHLIASATGHRSVTTHLFDDGSKFLDSDAVFGVKPSLVKHFTHHAAGQADRPAGVAADQDWYAVRHDLVLDRE
jgi:hydroxyquinol 1,2-dioxygenase